MERAQVPLWLGVILCKNNKCHIEIPQWMSVSNGLCYLDNLKKALEHDRCVDFVKGDSLYPLPVYYIEISRLLLEK